MTLDRPLRVTLILVICLAVAACGARRSGERRGGLLGPVVVGSETLSEAEPGREGSAGRYSKSSLWDAFGPNKADQSVNVNRYIWAASLDVLNFLPVQSVDPFTGVIVTGYGNPPGGGRAYRATVHVRDPALDARSLNVSLHSQGGGTVNPATARAIEDAILARARQLRIQDRKL